MLLQATPPDTSAYMIAGYTVFTIIVVIYLASLFFRRRNLERDLSTLQAMGAENRASEPVSPATKRAVVKRQVATRQAARRKPARKKVTRKK